ncbi:MAG: hypothetical protein HKP18_06695, partial [Acidimicrobiia bacterium]|nr:hypothetical protein [Acidimicrobiia bacterium]
VDPTNPFWDARLPIAATFVFNGQDVTVVNNHFSSKGGSSPLFGTIQPSVDLQEDPSVNGSLDERQAQATAIAGFTDAILDSDPNANVVVVGDFNEFEFISPLDVILGENLSNLTLTLPEDERYTFIFDGNSQALDHILVSDALEAGAVFDEVHVNVEFAATSTRASDHDPVLVGLDFSARTIKWTQVVELEALLGVGSRADDKLLKRAIRDLERSLADGLWTSNTTLSPIYGDLVFTRERQAASRLLQLSEALSESVYPVFESLLIADRQLAVIAIGIAGDTGGDLTAAERFLGLGDDDWAAGAYEMAITRYKQAWEEAVAATLP